MQLLRLEVVCDKCGCKNIQYVAPAPDPLYQGTILRSFHCENKWSCGVPQVIRYKFGPNGLPEVDQRIAPSDVFIEHEPPTGITIKPKSKSMR